MYRRSKKLIICVLATIIVLNITPLKGTIIYDINEFDPADSLKVLTTIGIVQDWVRQVGKGLFNPISLVSGLEDPHTYEMTTSERELLSEADVVVRLGLAGLESWLNTNLDAILEDNPSLEIITLVSDNMLEDDIAAEESFKNPHVWMSPLNAKIFVNNITASLISIDNSNKDDYERNRDNYLIDLNDLIDRIENEYKPDIEGLKVVVHHPSFMYLLDLLGVERVAIIEEDHDHHAEPGAKHIQEIIENMIDQKVKIIIVQPQVEEEQVLEIAIETGANLATLSPLIPAFGLTSYIALIEYDIYALQNPEGASTAPFSLLALIIGVFSLGLFIIFKKYITKAK